MSKPIVWQWNKYNGVWVDYDELASFALDEAFQNDSPSASIRVSPHRGRDMVTVQVDFNTMTQTVDIERPIRRIASLHAREQTNCHENTHAEMET